MREKEREREKANMLPIGILVKGNQKGKVTCYARERVNKNELF